MKSDIVTVRLGSIWTLQAVSPRGQRWVARHVPNNIHGSIVADHRCAVDIVDGMRRARLVLEDGDTGRQTQRRRR